MQLLEPFAQFQQQIKTIGGQFSHVCLSISINVALLHIALLLKAAILVASRVGRCRLNKHDLRTHIVMEKEV